MVRAKPLTATFTPTLKPPQTINSAASTRASTPDAAPQSRATELRKASGTSKEDGFSQREYWCRPLGRGTKCLPLRRFEVKGEDCGTGAFRQPRQAARLSRERRGCG